MQGATLIPSFVSTPGNFKLYQGTRTIALTPTPGGDVDLRTFKYSSTCNQIYYASQPYKLLSFPGFIRIQRQPTATITTPPFAVFCGDRTPHSAHAHGHRQPEPGPHRLQLELAQRLGFPGAK